MTKEAEEGGSREAEAGKPREAEEGARKGVLEAGKTVVEGALWEAAGRKSGLRRDG